MVIGAAVLLRLGAPAVRAVRFRGEALQLEASALRREEALIASADTIEARAVEVQQRLVGLAPSLVPGASRIEAAASLALRFERAAARNRARVERSDGAEDSTAVNRLQAVVLEATVTSDLPGLAGLLRDLESSNPVLAVEQVRLLAANPAGSPDEAESIRAELRVRGWFLGSGKSP
jgi:hypothetical protein